jgi:hypothetical protein
VTTAAVRTVDAEAEAEEPCRGWRYTARPEWSGAAESMWMRLAKFSLCNRLSVKALAALFAVEGASAMRVDLRCADRWNLQALATVLEMADDDVHAGFCVGPSRPAPGDASAQLRCCPACLEAGFHAAWFQWQLVERCPLHRLPLRTGCMRCTAPILYTLGHDLAAYPLSCASCGGAWVPSLSRLAGRCAPLGRRDSRLMRRWAVYIEHAVGDESHRPRTRPGTPVVPSPSARPHPLTMINRLFDAPPPQMADVLLRRHPAPVAPGARADGWKRSHRFRLRGGRLAALQPLLRGANTLCARPEGSSSATFTTSAVAAAGDTCWRAT